jgi:hypothetical protein
MPIKVPVGIPRDVAVNLVEGDACKKLVEYLQPRGAEPMIARHMILWLWSEGYELVPREKIIRPGA